MSTEAGFLGKTVALARKDLRIEARARDTLPPMLAFVLAVTLLLAFTLPGGSDLAAPVDLPVGTASLADVLAGFMWITILFAGLIGFARTFEVERSEGALDALLMAPVDRSGLFLSKAAANLVSLAIVEVILLPAFILFFDIELSGGWLALIGVIVLADVGFVSVGTLFAAVAAQTRSRELVLPILALPTLVPVFIGATELTSDLFAGGGPGEILEAGWFGVLAAFSLIFAILGALGSDFVLD